MIKKEPFIRYRYDEDKAKDNHIIFSVRLNQQEIAWLEEIKEDLNIKSNGKALKMSAFIGRKVLHGLLGRKFLRYLFKKDREKLEDYKRF